MSFDPWAEMDDVNGEPAWPSGDPRWQAYRRGWLAGYQARGADGLERLDPVMLDDLILARLYLALAAARGQGRV